MATQQTAVMTITENDGTTWNFEGVVRNGFICGKKGVKVALEPARPNCTVVITTVEVAPKVKSSTPRAARPDLTPMAAILFGKRTRC